MCSHGCGKHCHICLGNLNVLVTYIGKSEWFCNIYEKVYVHVFVAYIAKCNCLRPIQTEASVVR